MSCAQRGGGGGAPQQGGGVQVDWEGADVRALGGGVGSISKTRPSHYKHASKSFCESHTWRLVSLKALRELNAHWALPLYPVSEDEKSKGSDEKSVKRNCIKKTNRINIFAKNCVEEQLTMIS